MKLNPFKSPHGKLGFSLVEVVVAVGIFAIAIVSIIGLVSALSKSVSEITDADDASRVVTNLQGKLQSVSFDDLRNYIGDVSGKSRDARIYANRDGSKVGLGSATALWDTDASGSVSAEEDAQKYFLKELISNDDLSPSGEDNTAGYLAFTVRLIYPAYLGNGDYVEDTTQQSSLLVPIAVTR